MNRRRTAGWALVAIGALLPLLLLRLQSGHTPDLGLWWNLKNIEVVFKDSVRRQFASVSEFRKKYPMYADLDDREFARRLHRKYLGRFPLEEFEKSFLSSGPAAPTGVPGPDLLGLREKIEDSSALDLLSLTVLEIEAQDAGLYRTVRDRLSLPFVYPLLAGVCLVVFGLFLLLAGRRAGAR